MNQGNPYALPKADGADFPAPEPTPPRWSPNAAVSRSRRFRPIFGALLHRPNGSVMKQADGARWSKHWGRGSMVCFVGFVVAAAIPGVAAGAVAGAS